MLIENRLAGRIYNFSAGPAMLPDAVLAEAQQDLLNYQNTGMSVMEMSHRHELFINIAKQAEDDLRELLQVPDNYKILFLQGGGRGQFAAVPLNLLGNKQSADYLDIGMWSQIAIKEASQYCQVNVVASSQALGYTTVPDQKEWKLNSQAAYLHYVDNETMNGIALNSVPAINDVPLVADMSSNILSQPFDIKQFGVVYAGAQKNAGIAGLAVVIVRDDLLNQASSHTPLIFNYKTQAEAESMYNTPPTFAWYMAGLTFQWIKKQGGLAAMTEINRRKSDKLYRYIDESNFYSNSINPRYRSRMNVVFRLTQEDLTKLFVSEAAQHGLMNLAGHKLVGGVRASIYNAMPEQGIDALLNFMADFAKKHLKTASSAKEI